MNSGSHQIQVILFRSHKEVRISIRVRWTPESCIGANFATQMAVAISLDAKVAILALSGMPREQASITSKSLLRGDPVATQRITEFSIRETS